jgi:hypothetical protein
MATVVCVMRRTWALPAKPRHNKPMAITTAPIKAKIKLADYPQLRLLAWQRQAGSWLDEAEAFALYEANWRFVDQNIMDESELALVKRLTNEQGAGLLLV